MKWTDTRGHTWDLDSCGPCCNCGTDFRDRQFSHCQDRRRLGDALAQSPPSEHERQQRPQRGSGTARQMNRLPRLALRKKGEGSDIVSQMPRRTRDEPRSGRSREGAEQAGRPRSRGDAPWLKLPARTIAPSTPQCRGMHPGRSGDQPTHFSITARVPMTCGVGRGVTIGRGARVGDRTVVSQSRPAAAGMNLEQRQVGQQWASLPRPSGDGRLTVEPCNALVNSTPARAGMNRTSDVTGSGSRTTPRSGGEPRSHAAARLRQAAFCPPRRGRSISIRTGPGHHTAAGEVQPGGFKATAGEG